MRKNRQGNGYSSPPPWPFTIAYDVATELLDGFIYNPGEPGVDRSGPVIRSNIHSQTAVAVDRRFTGAGGMQEVLLSFSPPELWSALKGVVLCMKRLDTGAEVARAQVADQNFISFGNVRYNRPYGFVLEETSENTASDDAQAPQGEKGS